MKISVVTATWNSAATVRCTLESVLAQTYVGAGFEVEHIVVDGCSSDGTMAIVHEFEERYAQRCREMEASGLRGPVLRCVSEKDNGIYDAMNKGIRMATGDVIGLLNSDDFYTSGDVLATVAGAFGNVSEAGNGNPSAESRMEQGGVDAVYGDVHYVDDGDLGRCVRYYSSKGFRRWKMRFGYMPAHPSFYCRREVYGRFGLFDTDFRVAADFEQLLRLIYINGIYVRYIPKDFVTMRTGGASSSGLVSHKRIVREHLAAYRKNGVRSGWLHEAVRYACKGTAMVWHKVFPVRLSTD